MTRDLSQDRRWAGFQGLLETADLEALRRAAGGAWPERSAAVLNPNTPAPALESLAHDFIPFIARPPRLRLHPEGELPLSVTVALFDNTDQEKWGGEGYGQVIGHHCEEVWLADLKQLSGAVKAGDITLAEAGRYVEALPDGWVGTMLEQMELGEAKGPDEGEVDALMADPLTLVSHAHLLPEWGNDEDDSSEAITLLHDLLSKAQFLTPLPIHATLDDGELLAWLRLGAALTNDERSLAVQTLSPPMASEDGYTLGGAIPFPGGSLSSGETDRMVSSSVDFVVSARSLGFPVAGLHLLRALAGAVYPRRYKVVLSG